MKSCIKSSLNVFLVALVTGKKNSQLAIDILMMSHLNSQNEYVEK